MATTTSTTDITVELSDRPKTGDGATRDLSTAKNAYKTRDSEASKKAHMSGADQTLLIGDAEEKHGGVGSEYVKSIVFGGLDGIITTFAIVAASSAAGMGVDVILLMGFANLVADGISMGFGDYLSSKAELDYALSEKEREAWEVDNCLAGEIKEMVEIYMKKGMTKEEAESVITVFSRHKEMFVDLMMIDELGIQPPDGDEEPWKNGVVTFVSFLVFGSVPLWFYVGFYAAGFTAAEQGNLMFGVCFAATALTMFILGVFKASITHQNTLVSGFWMLLNGSLAAGAAYLVGWGFEVGMDIDMSGCGQ